MIDGVSAGYYEYFARRYGVAPDILRNIGHVGGHLQEMEFLAHGPAFYKLSVIQPIRNLYYSAGNANSRIQNIIRCGPYETPLLDFGCGIGHTLMEMDEMGYDDLHGIDVDEGPTWEVLRDYVGKQGVTVYRTPDELPRAHFKTVFCLNMLEHLTDPMATVRFLETLLAPGGRMLANCVYSECPSHIAPMEERRKVNDYLRERGWLIEHGADF